MKTETLPAGWKKFLFSQIAESITERVDDPSNAGVDRYVGLEHLDPESTKIRRWGSPEDVESTKLRFYPGDVVYARRRAYQKKLGVADFEGICSAHALVLRARPDACLPEFLPYFLQSGAFHQRALDISVGSLSPTINWKTLAVQEFALPPIDEQHRIIELLCAADRLFGAFSSVDVTVLRKALLAEALETSKLDCPLGEVISLEYGKSLSETRRDGGSYPVIGSAGEVGFHSVPLTTEDRTIVVGRKGTAGYVQLIDGPCWPIDTTYYVRLKVDLPLDFVFAQMQEIGLGSVVTATAVPGLNREDAYKLRFRIPDSKTISILIATLVQAESLGAEISQRHESVRLIRSALLDSMMAGEHV
jgi:hypothetical protein